MKLQGISQKGLSRIADSLESEYLYHVTFYNNLSSIDETGLSVGSGQGIGGGGNASYSGSGVFVTDAGGVPYWFSKGEDWGDARLVDDQQTYHEGLFPVVLRFVMDIDETLEDERGSSDSLSQAGIYEGVIPPEDIEVFNGQGWVPIEDWGTIDPDKVFEEERTEEVYGGEGDYEDVDEWDDRYGEPVIYYNMTDYLNPFGYR